MLIATFFICASTSKTFFFILRLRKIFKDPTAADIVFTSGADVLAVGLNITHQVVLTGNLFFVS